MDVLWTRSHSNECVAVATRDQLWVFGGVSGVEGERYDFHPRPCHSHAARVSSPLSVMFVGVRRVPLGDLWVCDFVVV